MYELRVTDGLTSCELAALPNAVVEYVPRTPQLDGVAPAGEPYPEIAPVRYAAIGESLRVVFGGDVLGLALAQRDALERLLRQAERVQAGSGEARVYVECRRSSETALYRCELLAGVVSELDVAGYWPGRGELRAVIQWTRRSWWEGEEVEIPLLGPLGDEQLGGMEVICAAGPLGASGYVDLSTIGGDLSSPLKLQFTNSAAGYPVARLYAALRSSAQPITLVHYLEGEAARAGGVTQPAGIDAQCSGGKYRALTWTGSGETWLLDWVLSTGQMALAAGRWYRLLARCYPAPAYEDLLLQARLTMGGSTTLWAGPWVRTSDEHEACDLGSPALPPFAGSSGDWTTGLAPLRLELWARRNAAGTHGLNLDYLALFAQDGFRRYDALPGSPAGQELDQGCYLVDDGPGGALWAHSAEGNANNWLAAGAPLAVRPGCRHRLCLLWENEAGQARADRLAAVQVWYRPRVALP